MGDNLESNGSTRFKQTFTAAANVSAQSPIMLKEAGLKAKP